MPPVSTMGLQGPSSQPSSLTGLGGLSGGKTNVIMFDQTKNPVSGRPTTDLWMYPWPPGVQAHRGLPQPPQETEGQLEGPQ